MATRRMSVSQVIVEFLARQYTVDGNIRVRTIEGVKMLNLEHASFDDVIHCRKAIRGQFNNNRLLIFKLMFKNEC